MAFTMRRKLNLALDHAPSPPPIHWFSNPPLEVPLPNEYGSVNEFDTLWIPFPTSKQPRVSYYNDSLEAEYELTRLTEEILLAIKDSHNSPVPDYVGAKNLYGRLLQWKVSKSPWFQSQTCVIPAWLCLM